MKKLKTSKCVICGKKAKFWHGYVLARTGNKENNVVEVVAGFCEEHKDASNKSGDCMSYGKYDNNKHGKCIPLFEKCDDSSESQSNKEKGCKYCNDNESLFYDKESEGIREVVIEDDGTLSICSNDYDREEMSEAMKIGFSFDESSKMAQYCKSIKINYCPMCGRKL